METEHKAHYILSMYQLSNMSSASSRVGSGDDCLGIIENPGDNDVIFGKGGESNRHVGNVRFREFLQKHKARYRDAVKIDKPLVTRQVLELWKRSQAPSSRFLKKEAGSENWIVAQDDKIRAKISDCLRDKRHTNSNHFINENQDQITPPSVTPTKTPCVKTEATRHIVQTECTNTTRKRSVDTFSESPSSVDHCPIDNNAYQTPCRSMHQPCFQRIPIGDFAMSQEQNTSGIEERESQIPSSSHFSLIRGNLMALESQLLWFQLEFARERTARHQGRLEVEAQMRGMEERYASVSEHVDHIPSQTDAIRALTKENIELKYQIERLKNKEIETSVQKKASK